jgi:GT2 family glycosyltransferase
MIGQSQGRSSAETKPERLVLGEVQRRHQADEKPSTCESSDARIDGAVPQGFTLSIIIPVGPASQFVGRCLQSIRDSNLAPQEVIVVLDGQDEDAARLAEHFGARVFRSAVRRGPASARNLAARTAQGNVLLFVDSDVTIRSNTLDHVLRVLAERPSVQAVIGSYDDAPSAGNFLSQYKNLLHHYVHQTAREEGFTFWGACGAIYREVFLKIGGFAETYRQPCVEDIDLGYRLRAAGFRIHVCKELQVTHHKRWTPWCLFCSDFFRRALPWTALILQSRRLDNDLNIDRASRIKVALSGGLVAALVFSLQWSFCLFGALACASALLILDARLLRFFYQKRGLAFAVRTIPWHWFSYFYSAVGFGIGLVTHFAFRRRRSAASSQPTLPPLLPANGLEIVQ